MPADPELPSPLAVVCHDAGACNVILPWLRRPDLQLQAVMQGPAERLWHARLGDRPLCRTLDQALDGAAMLLSGTGWASSLEHDARDQARQRGLRSAAVIDHWVNYPDRFERGGQVQWPDEFWVTDLEALAIAQRHFPPERVRCHSNPYLAEQRQAVAPLQSSTQGVLYVMEPMRSDWGRGVAGEWQALEWFASQRSAAGIPAAAPLWLRPHPSDETGKYDDWLARHPGTLLDRSATLAQAMSPARWVVGCESYALVVALAAGRTVFSTLPPWAPACRLPQAGIQALTAARTALTDGAGGDRPSLIVGNPSTALQCANRNRSLAARPHHGRAGAGHNWKTR